jgi:hypothetical protein
MSVEATSKHPRSASGEVIDKPVAPVKVFKDRQGNTLILAKFEVRSTPLKPIESGDITSTCVNDKHPNCQNLKTPNTECTYCPPH